MKIALAQLNPTVGDFAGNSAKILEFAQRAQQRGADLAVFSELCLCGYLPLDLIERPSLWTETKGNWPASPSVAHPVDCGLCRPRQRLDRQGSGKRRGSCWRTAPSNSCSTRCCCPPTTFSTSRAIFSPPHPGHFPVWRPASWGSRFARTSGTTKHSGPSPLYERDPVAELVAKGASLLINISASPYTIDKRSMRLDMLRALAKTHGRPVIYVNQVGGNDSLVFDGDSVVVLARRHESPRRPVPSPKTW